MKTILANHPEYRIILHHASNAPTRKLIVTFSGQPAGLSDAGFGTSYALKNGWDTIYVAQRHGSQFQGLSVNDFRDAIAPFCRGRETVCYGSSLGGYAALYYGGSINARSIAAAPMLPAWRPLGLKRYADVPITHSELQDAPRSTYAPVIIWDPMMPNDDRVVHEMIAPAYPNYRSVPVPYSGHTVLLTLAKAGILKPLLKHLIDHDEVIEFARPGIGTATFHGERGRCLIAKDRASAIAELRRSLRIAPSGRYYGMLVNTLLRDGQRNAAQQIIDQANASLNQDLRLPPAIRQVAENLGLTV